MKTPNERGFEVVGQAGDGVEALEQAERHRPDIVLLDLDIPPPPGAELIQRFRHRVPESRVLAAHGQGAPRLDLPEAGRARSHCGGDGGGAARVGATSRRPRRVSS